VKGVTVNPAWFDIQVTPLIPTKAKVEDLKMSAKK